MGSSGHARRRRNIASVLRALNTLRSFVVGVIAGGILIGLLVDLLEWIRDRVELRLELEDDDALIPGVVEQPVNN